MNDARLWAQRARACRRAYPGAGPVRTGPLERSCVPTGGTANQDDDLAWPSAGAGAAAAAAAAAGASSAPSHSCSAFFLEARRTTSATELPGVTSRGGCASSSSSSSSLRSTLEEVSCLATPPAHREASGRTRCEGARAHARSTTGARWLDWRGGGATVEERREVRVAREPPPRLRHVRERARHRAPHLLRHGDVRVDVPAGGGRAAVKQAAEKRAAPVAVE